MSAFERLLEQKAVALQYSPEKDTAPVIVASGMGYMAEKITEAARKSGVPVYEDDSLATLLSRSLSICLSQSSAVSMLIRTS